MLFDCVAFCNVFNYVLSLGLPGNSKFVEAETSCGKRDLHNHITGRLKLLVFARMVRALYSQSPGMS